MRITFLLRGIITLAKVIIGGRYEEGLGKLCQIDKRGGLVVKVGVENFKNDTTKG